MDFEQDAWSSSRNQVDVWANSSQVGDSQQTSSDLAALGAGKTTLSFGSQEDQGDWDAGPDSGIHDPFTSSIHTLNIDHEDDSFQTKDKTFDDDLANTDDLQSNNQDFFDEPLTVTDLTATDPTDDDFDDFGDFDQAGDDDVDEAFGSFNQHVPVIDTPQQILPTVKPLDIQSKDLDSLRQQISDIMSTAFPSTYDIFALPTEDTAADDEVSAKSLSLFKDLHQPATLPPFNWKRSRIRKLYMTALGVPVNLDEWSEPVASTSKPVLAEVKIDDSVRAGLPGPTSAPIIRVSSSPIVASSTRTRPTTPVPPVPLLDRRRAQALVAMTADDMQRLSVEEATGLMKEIQAMVALAGEVLTYSLERREKLRMDGETYDRMIQDLVSTAQKLKPHGSVTGSGLKRSGSLPRQTSRGIFNRSKEASPRSSMQRPPSRAGSLAS